MLCADGRSVVQHHVCLLTLLVYFLLAAVASVLGRLATVFVGCLLTPQLGSTTRRLAHLSHCAHAMWMLSFCFWSGPETPGQAHAEQLHTLSLGDQAVVQPRRPLLETWPDLGTKRDSPLVAG